jgi:hypothetical protein
MRVSPLGLAMNTVQHGYFLSLEAKGLSFLHVPGESEDRRFPDFKDSGDCE